MKEAFWGILIVVLGLFAVVAVNLFSEVTVDNDRSYYILKESTEGAMYDSLDLGYYRLHGVYRIVEEKFIESFVSRFTNNIEKNNYNIIVTDINELPPKVSLYLKSGVTSLQNDNFDIVNGIDAIIEAKYPISSVVTFLKISEDDYKELTNKEVTKDNYCDETISKEVTTCIDGEIKIGGWSDPKVKGSSSYLKEYVCDGILANDATSTFTYSVCECGKWESKTTGEITGKITHTSSENTYTFTYHNDSYNTVIDEKNIFIQKIDICTEGISLYAERLDRKISGDCNSGVWIGTHDYNNESSPDSIYVLPIYNPYNSVNRNLDWKIIKNDSLGFLTNSNPSYSCIRLRITSDTSCQSKAILTTKNTSTVNHEDIVTVQATTKDQTTLKSATCNFKYDTINPTCTIKISGDKAIMEYSDVGSGISEIGIFAKEPNTETKLENYISSGTYSKTIYSTGYYYGYVKDAVGNVGTCKTEKEVVKTTPEDYVCGSYCCSYSTSCKTVTGCDWIDGFGCIWTAEKKCSTSCSGSCNSYCTRYVCPGRTKINNSYCY